MSREIVRNLRSDRTHLADVESTMSAEAFGVEYRQPPTDTRALCGTRIYDGVVMRSGSTVKCPPCAYLNEQEAPTAPDAGTDVEALARVMCEDDHRNCGYAAWDAAPEGIRGYHRDHAETILASDWLAAHDATLITAAEARGAAEERERIAAEFHRLRGADILTDVRRIYIGPAEAGCFADYLARTAPAIDRTEATPGGGAHSLTDCWCGEVHRREDFL